MKMPNQAKGVLQDTEKLNPEEEEAFRKIAPQISEDLRGATFFSESTTSSGATYPGFINIPIVAKFVFGNQAKNYETSHDELPQNSPAQGLFCAILSNSSQYLIYLNFVFPRLRALYMVEYDKEADFSDGHDLPNQLKRFLIQREKMKKTLEQRQDVIWAKIVQTDSMIHTTIKTGGNLIGRLLKGGGYEYRKYHFD